MTALRTLAFGDDSVWGASWAAGSDGTALTALGSGSESIVMPGIRLPDSNASRSDEWRLDGEDLSLRAAPAGELVEVKAPQDGVRGWNQLTRVTGRFGQHEVDCLGLRSSWSDEVDLGRYQSIRAVSVWFDPDEAFALTAFRPRKAKAHDGDLLAASVIAADGAAAVEDPRLSTTYAGDGWPSRAGIELWLAGAGETDSERQYPRRASGEAIGARAQALVGELELRAEPFRWHSRAREGAGMYLLASRR
jgi:hypothetical protein